MADAPAGTTPVSAAVPRSGSWKEGLRGAWLLAVQLLLYDLTFRVAFRLSESVKDYPGANPPWYFIRRDAIDGACALVALTICLLIALFAWKRYPTYAPMTAAFGLIWLGGRVWKFLVISMYTHHLHQLDRTTSRWPTFDSYLGDPLFTAGQLGAFVLAFAFFFPGTRAARRAASKGVAA
jgi:hypothetical protein